MPKRIPEPSHAKKLLTTVQLLAAVSLTAQLPHVTQPVLIASLALLGVILAPRTDWTERRR